MDRQLSARSAYSVWPQEQVLRTTSFNSMRSSLPTLVFLLRAALASPYARRTIPVEEPPARPGSEEFYTKLLISAGLVLAGGVFAGCVQL